MSAPYRRKDPFPVYCFKVVFRLMPCPWDNSTAFFRNVSGLKYETDVVDLPEGGENRRVHRLIGATKWSNLVFKRGFTVGFELATWIDTWTRYDEKRRGRIEGTIFQLDTALDEICQWQFKDGWPCKWELSEMDASKSELAIETLEIAHEGLQFRPLPKL
ncbi:MAG: phage tail protein [Proteobacteria bacterium]|nr:phage tail protein [Pseudomonadota bacterium]